ncbi:hypothetical protein, partial [Chromobacterium alticapitis]|uniref:hypothetical protein n=1 Tax=Chromobacterium alticapitis TaxID=2073169 RepID=UPI001E55A611
VVADASHWMLPWFVGCLIIPNGWMLVFQRPASSGGSLKMALEAGFRSAVGSPFLSSISFGEAKEMDPFSRAEPALNYLSAEWKQNQYVLRGKRWASLGSAQLISGLCL